MSNHEVENITRLYGLTLKFVEDYGRVMKVYTDKGEFALKRMAANNGIDFFYYMQHLYQQGYNRIVPIFPALDGRYAILHGTSLYYLMPWLTNKEREGINEKNESLFRELARLHTLSVREEPVSKENREEHFERMNARWERELEALESFVEQSEKSTYMSPFQLLFCTYFSEITGGQRYAIKKLTEWKEATGEENKARSVIIHGKLSNEHFLYDENGYGYFTNFEKAERASPIHDLLPFLSRTMHTYPKQFDESVSWIMSYFKYFPFTKDEMLLFLGYLAHPGSIFRVVEKYFSSPDKKDEIKFIRQLQKQYWQMKNIEYVVMKIDEIERAKNEQNPA
ncbi:spore coat protein YsxE [Pseudogracilibacillus auburnensis]|uniref:spore coat protein YsxE n=1 Tax=Pseudogracilibacillus auburnensis TaxID=1494959 RepID=UPI001A97308B|nr:spore coat protein YsxE [Pseudogracilibacillus auburnensis]MBO1005588.1 spore coat protein YsxE [Pseudogracilibacillus auburnensis]